MLCIPTDMASYTSGDRRQVRGPAGKEGEGRRGRMQFVAQQT